MLRNNRFCSVRISIPLACVALHLLSRQVEEAHQAVKFINQTLLAHDREHTRVLFSGDLNATPSEVCLVCATVLLLIAEAACVC